MKYKVLITTSGVGSRLGELTRFTNKSLVKVGKKPAISYIVELYPPEIRIVVTLGYYGNQVRDFLKLAYPSRKFIFVKIDKYKGEGSSLLYSMSRASKYLQCPFIYHACDTIVTENVPPPIYNWNGGYKGNGSSQYASFDILNGNIQKIYDKGMLESDYLHIGLVGIKDYKRFWEIAERILKKEGNNGALNDVVVIRKMLKDGLKFKLKDFSGWYDTGNVESLNLARKNIKDSYLTLDKTGQSIYLFEDFVIKFFSDPKIVSDRVKRAKGLGNLVPQIVGTIGNFYKYKFIKGQLLSDVPNPEEFRDFLVWSKTKLWKPSKSVSDKKFKDVCKRFYYQKTVDRVKQLLSSRSIKDRSEVINGYRVPSTRKMLDMVDWDFLCSTKQSCFHGDYILDNIIRIRTGYCLLDWRQDFGGLLKSGDMYYDLAKLNHNLIVNHELVNKNLFTIKIGEDGVKCDILRKGHLVESESVFWKFVKENKFDERKIKLITALIWLNMSPLHTHPFDLFLYYFGKYNLWRILNEKD
jgi:dTDP-glucose pyrophosphorylase